MSATAAIEIGSDLWNAGIYESLATASKLAAVVDLPKGKSASDIDGELAREFLDRLNESLAEELRLIDDLNAAPVGLSKEKLIACRNSYLALYEICERILVLSERNNTFGQLQPDQQLLRAQSERLLDVVDWFDALSTPEKTGAIFKAAEIDFANGDFVPLAAVK
jgi:hypothetical protein